MVRLHIPGTPVPQGSKRVVRGNLIEANPDLRAWRKVVTARAVAWTGTWFGTWEPLTGPVKVDLLFRLPRPKSVRRQWPCVRPDLDKLARAILDGLTDARVWKDDGQVVTLTATKVYVGAGEEPGVRVCVAWEGME